MSQAALQRFLSRNALGEDYLHHCEKWFNPLITSLKQHLTQTDGAAIIVGINGCQGSGKSTLSDYLCTILEHAHDISAVTISLDDFYQLKSERQQLAETVHPLLATRGVPGTHDLQLATHTLSALKHSKHGRCELPLFDKSIDDRSDRIKAVDLPVQIVLFEGWCIGATPQTEQALLIPTNQLEREQDTNGQWRRYVNNALADYSTLFSLIDYQVMLKAPAFDSVLQWRIEQERKMESAHQTQAIKATHVEDRHFMTDKDIHQFIQHYQRITEHCLNTLPGKAHHLFELDHNRNIVSYTQPLVDQ